LNEKLIAAGVGEKWLVTIKDDEPPEEDSYQQVMVAFFRELPRPAQKPSEDPPTPREDE